MCCRSVVKAGGSVQLALAMMRSKQAKKKRALANTLARTLPSIPFLQTDGDQVASAVVAVAGGSLREEGRQQGSNELPFCDLLSGFRGRRVLLNIFLSFRAILLWLLLDLHGFAISHSEKVPVGFS